MNPTLPRSFPRAFTIGVLLWTLAACGGGGGSTAAPTDQQTATVKSEVAPDPAPTDATEPAPAASPNNETVAADLPTAEAICGLVTLAQASSALGVEIVKATPTADIPTFPQCRWETADDIIPGIVNVTLCCPGITEEQGASSLALRGAKELAPGMNGVVYTDDTSRAQIHALRADVYFDAVLTNIGPANAVGVAKPTDAELTKLAAFVELLASKL